MLELDCVHLRNVVLDDGLEVASSGRVNLSLDLVSGTALNEANDSLKFILASELFSYRGEAFDLVTEVIRYQHFIALGVENNDRIESVAGCAPFILYSVPRWHDRDLVSRFE